MHRTSRLGGVIVIGAATVRRTRLLWLTLVWLGAFLMLGALGLPVRAAAGEYLPLVAAPHTLPADAAGRVRAALSAQGYVVTDVGLSGDGRVAGVMMQPASSDLPEQIQAGWQALAAAYPQATWLLSGYAIGNRYRVCVFRSAQAPSFAFGQMRVYDTRLGRWVQPKDLAHQRFGLPAQPATTTPADPPPASQADSANLSDGSTGPRLIPASSLMAAVVAMHVEEWRRWLPQPDSTPDALVTEPGGAAAVSDAPARRDVRGSASVAGPGCPAEARWRARAHPAHTEDTGEDPSGDPPPTHHLLLGPPFGSNLVFFPHAIFPYVIHPDPAIRPVADADLTSPVSGYWLAWPALRVRPPPLHRHAPILAFDI